MEVLVSDQRILIFVYVLLITVVLCVKNDLVRMNESKFFLVSLKLSSFISSDVGICQESPCGNRGLCVETGLFSFECRCYFDYMGPLCEEHVPKTDASIWSCKSQLEVYPRRIVCFILIFLSLVCSTHTCTYTSPSRYIARSLPCKSTG